MPSTSQIAAFCACVMFTASSSASPAPAAYDTLYSFTGNADGAYPLQQNYIGGALYGLVARGAQTGRGGIYKVDPATGAESTLYSFTADEGAPASLASTTVNGSVIYTETYYKVISYDTATGVENSIYNGNIEYLDDTLSLIYAKQALYGSTAGGTGSYGNTIYRIDPASGIYTSVYKFGVTDKAHDPASLIFYKNVFYGTVGGACGNVKYAGVFSLDPSSGTAKLVCAFKGLGLPIYMMSYGDVFYGFLVRDQHKEKTGWLFQYDPKTRKEKTLFTFTGGANGATPVSQLTVANGVLYGMTSDGGSSGCGTIFSLQISSQAYSQLYSFPCSPNNAPPVPNGIIGVGGVLYGTTAGGADQYGSVFSFTP